MLFNLCFTSQMISYRAFITLTVRFMKFKNFFSISVMMEKSPLGRCCLTVVTLIWEEQENACECQHKHPFDPFVCACSSHLTALAQAAQQQGGVGSSDAVLHVFACMLQSYNTPDNKSAQSVTPDHHSRAIKTFIYIGSLSKSTFI